MVIRRISRFTNNIQKIFRHYLDRQTFFTGFRGLVPISRMFGYDRGPQSIARYYIDKFLEENCADVKEHVLEIGDNKYTKRLGGTRVTKSDVLHVSAGNPVATFVADLTQANEIPSNTFNCILLPQTLQFIFDIRAAMFHLERILMPRGVLLVTLSGISQISRYDMDRWGEYWRFTTLSAQQLFEEFFPVNNLRICSFGNVLTATALLYGLASRELSDSKMDYHDDDYQVIIAVRAVKPAKDK
jgi:hypothetical protein